MKLSQYIFDILGIDVHPEPISIQQLGSLPMFIGETYQLYNLLFLNQQLVLVEPKGKSEFSTLQTEKHLNQLKDKLEKKLVLVLNEITAYERKKLIEKGINFIVPGKQLYLPDLLLDLRENYTNLRAKRKIEKLLPSAQFMVIYHVLHRNEEWKLEEHSFKEIAKELGYTAMAITKAVNNLRYHEIIDVEGEKEKCIRFKHNRSELWQVLEQGNLFVNPVLKRVYVDEKPSGVFMLHTNTSALHEYSD
ncbi:MAG: MarR family transcriptional regulator, partial [Bacteroidetes bacterium]